MVALAPEEFKIRSELEAVHLPTGTVFVAYPYTNPDDLLQSIRVNWGRIDLPPESVAAYAEQVKCTASQLLLERARRAVRDRQLRNAA